MADFWKDWHLKDLVYVATLLIGVGATYTAVTYRIADLEEYKKTDKHEFATLLKEHTTNVNKIALMDSILSRLDGDVKTSRETSARTFEVITTIQISMAEIKQEIRSIRDLVRNDRPHMGMHKRQ